MRPTVNLDEELLAKAAEVTGRTERSALLRMALEALVERESARRLALLGGLTSRLVQRCGRGDRE